VKPPAHLTNHPTATHQRPGGLNLECYTFGYSGRKLEDIIRAADREDLTIADIRLVARSRKPDFNKGRLSAALGQRYIHLQEFGNLNYRRGGMVVLADSDAGVWRLSLLIGKVAFMCACKNFEECHRSTVAQILSQRGISVQELVF